MFVATLSGRTEKGKPGWRLGSQSCHLFSGRLNSRVEERLPIKVQVVGKWQAESTILHLASLLESLSTVRNLHPNL